MEKNAVLRFFDDVGVKLRPSAKARTTLYTPRAGERIYAACEKRKTGDHFAKLFYIRVRSGTGATAEIMADAVILGRSTIMTFNFWKRKPVPASTAATDESFGVDVNEVEYPNVLSLRFRWVGMTAKQVEDAFLVGGRHSRGRR
jgi:hypothetical protein